MSELATLLDKTLEDYLAVKQAPRPNKDEWWCSEAGSCYRKRVLRRNGTPMLPVPLNSMLTREYGKLIERIFGRGWEKKLDVVRQGKVWIPEMNMRGHFDFLIFVDDLEITACIDAKSANGQSFGFATRKGDEAYRMQNAAYAFGIEKYGYTLSKVGMVGTDATDECIEQRPPTRVTDVAIYYGDKEYGNTYLDEYDKDEYIAKLRDDMKELERHWAQYTQAQTLPPETPFAAATKGTKHVRAGRAAIGEMVPSGLCSPAYCGVIHACPKVAAWWKRKAAMSLEPPR